MQLRSGFCGVARARRMDRSLPIQLAEQQRKEGKFSLEGVSIGIRDILVVQVGSLAIYE